MKTFPRRGKFLVTVADDFGESSAVNRAVAEAHDRGVLIAASIMAGGDAFEEALQLALDRPQLSCGLHLTLCDGRAVLPVLRIPDLVDSAGYFERSPVKAWLNYSGAGLISQIEDEVDAQFERLERAGLRPTHVDCHHHLHMHPSIFEIVCRQASHRGVGWIRIPREPLRVILRSRSLLRGMMPFIEWAVFGVLGVRHRRIARKYGLSIADCVYGLSHTGSIDEKYFLDILKHMRGTLNEIFTHPDVSTESGRGEVKALTSTTVRRRLDALGMTLVGYRELSDSAKACWSAWGRS
jgi:hopanoid biosynthesis associated protein HpnK